MMFDAGPHPQFSWSLSRARLLEDCPRAYYLRYYAAHRGWLGPDEAPELSRLAYRLKQLKTLHQVLGTAIHECARRCVEAIRAGADLPSHRELLMQVLATLRAVCAGSKHREAFLRDPRRSPMVHSVYYEGGWDLGEVESVKTKLERCLASLVVCPVWNVLREMDPEGIVLVDQLEAVDVGGVLVYAAPDLVLRDTPGGHVTVIDWKTGTEADEEAAIAQLALYALVVIRRFGWRFDDHTWSGRIVRLIDGHEQPVDLTRLDLMRASHRIRESVEEMRGYLEDFKENRPRPMDTFPLVQPVFRSQCRRCVFYEVCRVGLEGMDAERGAEKVAMGRVGWGNEDAEMPHDRLAAPAPVSPCGAGDPGNPARRG